ncbi:syntaxin [Desmophyllum pertusum]|uniref:Syntaxin n=1 Tax=Desmophyllum pertusum TaxID=174260 RepID=A0A9W9YJX7_9CNID|nr:syntaxin [Desmophyllum pertusum]
MKEIESTRSQIQLSDLPEFDDRIKSIQDEVLAGVSSFREVQQMYAREKQDKEPKRMPFAKTRNTALDITESMSSNPQQLQTQLVIEQDAIVSWDSLREGLEELNELIHDFSSLVHEQQDTIDSIESNIESAQVNVEDGTSQLGKASKLKIATYPLIGAVVGGICGGPVGLAIGLKPELQ